MKKVHMHQGRWWLFGISDNFFSSLLDVVVST